MVYWRLRENYLFYNAGKKIITEAQPFQFIMCGFIQLVTDTFLVMQMLTYGKDYSNVESELP